MSFHPFNSFRERKKKRDSTDELAIVKAAAWAWYQHGSGSEKKPMCAFDITTTHQRNPTPSRYKLEATMNIAVNANAADGSQTPSPAIHTDNSLLDAYEIKEISKRLDCLIESSSQTNLYRALFARDDHRKNIGGSTSGKKKKSKNLKGLLLGHAVVCGRREDVDTRAFGGSQQPAKGGHVVKMTNCKPRATHA